jgi:hypothetical protein
MSLVLDGTNGLSEVDGSAATPAIRGTDTNTGIFFPAADTIAFAEGGAEVARFDPAGNFGLGVPPSAWASGYKAFQLNGASFYSDNSGTFSIIGRNVYDNGVYRYRINGTAESYEQFGGQHVWKTAPSGTAGNSISFTQAMTLDASGNLLVGKTSASASSGVGVQLEPGGGVVSVRSSSTNSDLAWYTYSTGAGAARFYVGMGGQVYATSTSISAISDRTLKENVRDLETGLSEVMALKPRRFDWKNGDAQNVAGFVAQEVEEVLPELVTDYVYNKDEDGNNIIKKSLKMGDILPTLVKAIQEQQAIITALTAQVATLDARLISLEGTQP